MPWLPDLAAQLMFEHQLEQAPHPMDPLLEVLLPWLVACWRWAAAPDGLSGR